jgi:hypothetical protein
VVSPGFWHARETTPRLDRDPNRFRSDVRRTVAAEAFWQLVTSWNEWGEDTSVEPADEFGTQYLDILADEFGGEPTVPSPTTTTTTTTITTAPRTTTRPPKPGAGFSLAAGGDFGATSRTDATLRSIAGSDADFMLAPGDLSYGDSSASAVV